MLYQTIEEFKQNICREGLSTELDKEIFKLIEESNKKHNETKEKEIKEYLKIKKVWNGNRPIKTKKR